MYVSFKYSTYTCTCVLSSILIIIIIKIQAQSVPGGSHRRGLEPVYLSSGLALNEDLFFQE